MHLSSRSISDETLMGYILLALPAEEQSKIDAIAAVDGELESRIADLRSLLAPIQESMVESFEPRGSLVHDTMNRITEQTDSMNGATASLCGMSTTFENAGRNNTWAWVDSLVVVAAGVTILCLLLPSVWFSREEARRIACANNLRQLGEAIQGFAHGNERSELPSIDLAGPLSFAGVYAMKLNDFQLIDSPRWVWCPSNDIVKLDMTIPSVAQFVSASPAQQQSWRRTMGGSYSYSLGFLVNGKYKTPSMEEPFDTPIIGDTLLDVSLEEPVSSERHAVTCANILFTNGSVRQIQLHRPHPSEWTDHPYLNRQRIRSAGIGRDDNCLGPSHSVPILPAATGPTVTGPAVIGPAVIGRMKTIDP